eukprot:gene7679-biopygen8047
MSCRDVFAFAFVYLHRLWDWFAHLFKLKQLFGCVTANRSPVGVPPVDQPSLEVDVSGSVTTNRLSSMGLSTAGEPHRGLFQLVDLCLLRTTAALRHHVLPYGIRRLIEDFLGAMDNDSIRTAVKLWIANRNAAIARYGHISLWDTHRVTDMSRLFYGQQSFNDDISGWDVTKVTTLSHTFYDARAFNQAIGTWNTSNVTDMNSLFEFAVIFNQPLEDWDVSSVTSMARTFCVGYAFNQPVSKWNVSSVTNMNFMFAIAVAFNQPLNDWDVSRVGTTGCMFGGATVFNQPLDQWDLASATDISGMFHYTSAFNQPLVSWNVASIARKQQVFLNAVAYRQPETMAVWRAAGYTD